MTTRQKEVLRLITEEYLTPAQTAKHLKISRQAVYKLIKKLKNKGLLIYKGVGGFTKGGAVACQPQFHMEKIRLHNEQFKIIPYKFPKDYIINKTFKLDYNTIITYKKCIMVFSNQSFYAKTETEALNKSNIYWDRFFIKLENVIKVSFLKDRKQNIIKVNSHFAEINNELAKACIEKKKKLQFKDPKDNKTWLLADFSKKKPELETVHPNSAFEDMGVLRPFFEDLRQNPVKLSDLYKLINIQAKLNIEQAEISKNNAEALTATVTTMNTILKLITPKETIEKEQRYNTDITKPADYIG